MRKLLTRLEKSGLSSAAEGVSGGWQLSRPPEEIGVLAIVDAAQGKDPLFECREIRRRCALWPDDRPPRGRRAPPRKGRGFRPRPAPPGGRPRFFGRREPPPPAPLGPAPAPPGAARSG